MRIIKHIEGLDPSGNSSAITYRKYLQKGCSNLKKLFTVTTICTVLSMALFLAYVRLVWDPPFIASQKQLPRLAAYTTIMGVVVCVVFLSKGVRQDFVFVGFVAVLSAVQIIAKKDILKGFSRDGVWVPQLLLIIIGAIHESGLLEDILSALLGTREVGIRCRLLAYLRLQCGCLALGAMLGAGCTVATAAPMVARWATNGGFACGPPLMLVVVSATCGSVLLLYATPVNLVINEIVSSATGSSLHIITQSPPALVISALLIPYALCIGPCLLAAAGGRGAAAATAGAALDGLQPGESYASACASAAPAPTSDSDDDCPGAVAPHLAFAASPEVCEEGRSCTFRYNIDFFVDRASSLCGQTPQSAGIRRENGVEVVTVVRTGRPGAEAADEVHAGTETLNSWEFNSGDVIVARCSVAGIIEMRRKPGVFVLRAIHCNNLLGGKRHRRRLYECVVADSCAFIGQTLEQMMGLESIEHDPLPALCQRNPIHSFSEVHAMHSPPFLQQHRGYPVAGWRQVGDLSTVPLSLSADPLAPGDVLLVDAFDEFPSLPGAARDFLVAAQVPNSQPPRHGRTLDRKRGILATCALLLAVVMADVWGFPLVLGTLIAVVLLCLTRAVHAGDVVTFMNWPLLVSTGAGEGISEAMLNTGVADSIARLVADVGDKLGLRMGLLTLVLFAQVMANTLSPLAAGLILTPLAVELVKDHAFLTPRSITVILVITCNMVLSTPFGTPSNAAVSRLGGLRPGDFLRFGLPAQAIVSAVVVWWACWISPGTSGQHTVDFGHGAVASHLLHMPS